MTPSDRLVMIGIDAGDLGLIRAMLDELPHLRSFLAEAELSELTSPADVLTSAVWPTFATGLPPGEHGIYYPMQWDPSTMRLRRVAGDWIRFEPFWYALARRGLRATVLDVPFSLPSRLGDDGVEVVNWGSQESLGGFGSNRRDVAAAVRQRFGRHPMGADVPVEASAARLARAGRDLAEGAARKGALARWLMAETDHRLFVTVFAECHRAGHLLWPAGGDLARASGHEPLRAVYRAVDTAIGELIAAAAKDATIVVFSAHGIGRNDTQEHFVPAVVERAVAAFRGQPFDTAAGSAGRGPIAGLRAVLPPSLQRGLATALPAALRDAVVRRQFTGGLDWQRTPGFVLPGSCESYLRFNLAGREARGVLDAEGREDFDRLLDAELRALTTADGRAVVAAVVDCARHYPGARTHLLPDRVIRWRDEPPADELRSPRLGAFRARLTTGRTGDHRAGGFALTRPARRSRTVPLRDIADLATLAQDLLA